MHRWNVPRVLHGRNLAKIVVLSLLLSGALASPAVAGTDWCDNDPVVTIPGHTARIVTGFESDYRPTLDHLSYQIIVPRSIYTATTVDARHAKLPTVAWVSALPDAEFARIYPAADFAVTVHVYASATFPTKTTISGKHAEELVFWGPSGKDITAAYSFAADD